MAILRQDRRRGSAMLEFALVGVTLLFVWISIVQMAIGMWQFHNLQYAVKVAAAYMAVHGDKCALNDNACNITIGQAARVLKAAAIGIPAGQLSVKFSSYATDHVTTASGAYPVTCNLSDCVNNPTPFPPAGYGDPGCDVRIEATFVFRSALAMMAPGAGYVRFGAYNFKSSAQQAIVF